MPDPIPNAPDVATATEEELTKRTDWFATTPNPWKEITRLEFGGDRTYASTVNRMVLNAEPAQRPRLEGNLVTALGEMNLTAAGRVFVCRMLGLIGSKTCVPVVARLLDDEQTADVARMALDGIDDPGVDEVYRAALGKLRGPARIGLIGSIAVRRDTAAVEALTAIAIDGQEAQETREAAERAVKRILAKTEMGGQG